MNDEIVIQICDFYIKVIFRQTDWLVIKNRLYHQVVKLFNNFICKQKPTDLLYTIELSDRYKWQNSFIFKKANTSFISLFQTISKNKIITFYDISIFQFQTLVKTLIQKKVISEGGSVLHASAVSNRGKADIFIAPSGGGKTTIIKLLKSELPVLANDSVLLRKRNKKYYFYQTPFFEKETWIKRAPNQYSLGNIYFLSKDNHNSIRQIAQKKALEKLLPPDILYRPYVKNIMEFASRQNNFYILFFSNKPILSQQLIKLLRNNQSERN